MPDTIYALATPPGEGGVAVIRLSGPDALFALKACFPRKRAISDRCVYVGKAREADGEIIDEAVFFYMAAPRSYTREDVAEIQCHGGAICARRIMARLAQLGLRAAQPGEFTRRAFENGRISLSQAESVMELISARSQAAARSALRQMTDGGMRQIRERIIRLLGDISAADDFPEEVEEPILRDDVQNQLTQICAALRRASDPRAARLTRDGATVALSGRPNVGKSSLMNAILGCERALVDAEAGTTRDVLAERVDADGRLFTLLDTAGQRREAGRIEMAGIARALEAEKSADVVLAVLDISQPLSPEDEALLARRDERFLILENKSDLPAARDMIPGAYPVSARTGEGIGPVMEEILARADVSGMEEALSVPRQIELAARARSEAESAMESLSRGDPIDLCAIPLWDAAFFLGELTGEEASEDVIGSVFSRFCVGK